VDAFLNCGDIIDIGFAYPWITTPQQVYTTYVFSSFDGVLVSYEFVDKEFRRILGQLRWQSVCRK
jgi:hypothetical protein